MAFVNDPVVLVTGADGGLGTELVKAAVERGADAGQRNGGIRTPDQRLRVFVSSTLEELAAERAAARAAIEQSDVFVARALQTLAGHNDRISPVTDVAKDGRAAPPATLPEMPRGHGSTAREPVPPVASGPSG